MGTRGLFGFYWGGHFYVVYNHMDSYPTGLGVEVIDQVILADLDQWRLSILGLKVVDESKPPTLEQQTHLQKWTNLNVSTQSLTDWYCLLRGCQGSLQKTLDSGYIINYTKDDGQPAFQDYAYIINFDTNMFDFYDGDQLTSSTPLVTNDLKALKDSWLNN